MPVCLSVSVCLSLSLSRSLPLYGVQRVCTFHSASSRQRGQEEGSYAVALGRLIQGVQALGQDGMMVLNSAPAQPPARAKTKVVTAAADGAASGAALAAGVWAADSAQHGPHSVDGRQLFCHLGVDSMQLLPPPAGDENDMSRRMLFTMRYIPTEGADESTADSAGPACSESDSD